MLRSIQPMSQQDASKTRPYRRLVLDSPAHALVSLTLSKLGCTKLIFIKPGAKINGQYYQPRRLADAEAASSDPQHCWRHVFQQDNATAHRTRDTVELLRRETPQFINPCGKPTFLTSTR